MSIQNLLLQNGKGRQYPNLKFVWKLGYFYYPLRHFSAASISQGHYFFQRRIWKKINLQCDFEGHQYEVEMN